MKIVNEGKILILRQNIADGEIGNEKFDVGISGGTLVFNFPDTVYTVSIQSITKDVIKLRESEKKPKKIKKCKCGQKLDRFGYYQDTDGNTICKKCGTMIANLDKAIEEALDGVDENES